MQAVIANFQEAYLKEFWTAKKETRTEHIAHIRLQGDKNNNRMERMNGEVRDREKVMHSLKTEDAPILKGMQIFHNYIRPHMALEKQTPAQRAGISIQNSWNELLKLALANQSSSIK